MSKRYKWLDMHGQYISKNAAMTSIDFIQCGKCGYITNPTLTTFKIGKDSYGLLILP